MIDSFLRYLEYERRRSAHTLVAYSKDLDQFLCFGEEMVEDFSFLEVDGFLIRAWVIRMMDEKKVPRTVRRKVSTLSTFFRFLMREGVVDKNPCDLVVLPKVRKKLPFFVGIKEMDVLFDSGMFPNTFTGVRDRAVLSLFYGAGLRLTELVDLKSRFIDFDRCTVKVLGKGDKERIIPIPNEVVFFLQEYDSQRESKYPLSGDFFFLTNKGEQVYQKFVYRLVKRYLGRVTKIEKRSPHVLRHSYATNMLNNGADLNAIKELLGHASLAATQVYTHTSFEKLKEIYKQAHPRA